MDREFIQIERSQGAWHLIFQKLHQIARANAGSQQVAKKPMNAIRNRYRDVLPIDDTRVKLDDEDNDYINANFVTVEEVNRRYILSQGPLQHTCPHFWQMIWEQKSAAIVMLNKCIERGMNKCFPYWPLAEDPPLEAGKFHIENLGTEEESCYRLSHLKVINTENDESRVIMHFHYTHWPDFGVPQNPDVFLEFLYAVRNSGCLSPDSGPVVVHCSAGIGRSGTFCLVDVILAKLEQTRDLGTIDLQQILLSMRRQRLGLIQTADQLRFSYIAILQGALQDLELEPSNYDDLSDSDEDVPEEEDSDEESDSDEDVPQEERYPHLTRQYGRSQTYDADDDVPPPLPPRPPDTLNYSGGESEDSDEERQGLPPPPPPNSLPPGPPSTHSPYEEDDDLLPKKMKLEQNHDLFSDLQNGEEYGFKLAGNDDEEFEKPQNSDTLERYHSEEEMAPPPIHNNIDEQQHNEEKQGEEEVVNSKESVTPPPPPVPPRSHSLSPSPNQTPYHDRLFSSGASGGNGVDIYGDQEASSSNGTTTTRPFLGQGRGGDKNNMNMASPPLPMNHMEARSTAAAVAASPEDDVPPPLPAKQGKRRQAATAPAPPSRNLHDIQEEEQALITILDELERSMANRMSEASVEIGRKEAAPVVNRKAVQQPVAGVGSSDDSLSAAEIRQRERDARRARIHSKVQTIKEHLKQHGDETTEAEWSIPWLLVGFIVMLGYCAYYVMQ